MHNAAKSSIRLSAIKPLKDNGDRVLVSTLAIAPGATAYIPVSLVLDGGPGFVNHYFAATSDETNSPVYQFTARAFVNTVLDEAKPRLNFGVVDADGPSRSLSITLTSREVANLKILKVMEAPPYVDVSIENDRQTLNVATRSAKDWGLHQGYIRVQLNAPQQNEARIMVGMDVHGEIVPAENPVDVGLMRQGKTNETLIRLASRNGKGFRIGKLGVNGIDAKVAVEPCVASTVDCRLLKLTFDKNQPVGEIRGQVLVELPDYSQTLPIFVWGMLVKPDAVVRTIGKDSNDDPFKLSSKGILQSSGAVQSVSIQDAIKNSIDKRQDASQPVPGRGPLLKWSVANETNLYGYLIYRSNSENGPWLRVNSATILRSGHNDGASTYQWRDTTAVPGQTYWYYVGLVYNDGHKQQLTGPQKVIAK